MRKNYRHLIILTFISLLVFSSIHSHAETYKWLDDDGVMHFSDDPTNIPDKHKKEVKTTATINERWVFVGTDKYGSQFYIDSQTSNTSNVILKKVMDKYDKTFAAYKIFLKRAGIDPDRYSYSILTNGIDCYKKYLSLLSYADYDYSGSMLYQSSKFDKQWILIIPGNMSSDDIFNIACKAK